ncbi:MAG: hypothetical protein Q4B58_05660 [Bacteroidales bacterium]|nr:hypothetical protein [Bacteroidales bacterium]
MTIEYHTLSVKITCEQLQMFKSHGMPTDPMTCFQAAFMLSGKTMEELQAYMEEADAAGGRVSVSFEAPDGGALNIKSKEENPLFDEIVQMVEENMD